MTDVISRMYFKKVSLLLVPMSSVSTPFLCHQKYNSSSHHPFLSPSSLNISNSLHFTFIGANPQDPAPSYLRHVNDIREFLLETFVFQMTISFYFGSHIPLRVTCLPTKQTHHVRRQQTPCPAKIRTLHSSLS